MYLWYETIEKGKHMPRNYHLSIGLFVLMLVSLVAYSCTGTPPPRGDANSDDTDRLGYGTISGTILGCDGELLRDCRVDINAMPENLVTRWLTVSPRSVYKAVYFEDATYHDTVRTNSAGRFRFENLPTGYYQIWFWFDLRLYQRDSCNRYQLAGSYYPQVDFVRVAPDSVSFTQLSAQGDPSVKFAREWLPEFESVEEIGEKDEIL